jgi:hypothetical protein
MKQIHVLAFRTVKKCCEHTSASSMGGVSGFKITQIVACAMQSAVMMPGMSDGHDLATRATLALRATRASGTGVTGAGGGA